MFAFAIGFIAGGGVVGVSIGVLALLSTASLFDHIEDVERQLHQHQKD